MFSLLRRTTYFIGKDGEIKHVFESFFSYNYHITNVMKALQKDAPAAVAAAEYTPNLLH